jgi:hypothetical protein
VPSPSVHSIFLQPSMKAGTNQKIVSLILHNLRSYPQMIRQNTLPPFIHPQLACGDTDNGYIEPLANCISLMYMIGGGMTGSRKLFWKNVRLECEKLFVEVRTTIAGNPTASQSSLLTDLVSKSEPMANTRSNASYLHLHFCPN